MGEVRNEIKWFADGMEVALKDNEHKGGWKKCPDSYLLDRIADKVITMYREQNNHPQVKLEIAVDIANYAMMIADNASEEG